MRIVFVTNNYKPYSGGVVSSIDATVQELQSQGHEVLIATLNFLGEEHKDPDHVVRLFCPIRFMYKKNYMAIPFKPTQKLCALIKDYAPDIIHVHHPFLLGWSGLAVARSFGIPCVFTYHTMYEQFAHYVPIPQLISKPIIRLLISEFCSAVDGIIAPSTEVKEQIRSAGIISPIEVIPSALRSHFLLSQTCDYSVKNKDKKFFEILLVTRFAKEKNIPFVFDVFKRLTGHVRLTLVGYGTEYENMQRHAFDILRLPVDRVRFIHKPEQSELLQLYQSADLFIFPSQADTQGLVMVEAMSQGLPVVTLDGPGQRDIITQGENGFIVADDEHAAFMIQKIMTNESLYQSLRSHAYLTAQKYKPHFLVRRLCRFYNEIDSKS